MGDVATDYLKQEIERCGVTYKDLAARMDKHGVKETEASLAEKLRQGRLNAEWFLAALRAISPE